jgi:hypothetical protein
MDGNMDGKKTSRNATQDGMDGMDGVFAQLFFTQSLGALRNSRPVLPISTVERSKHQTRNTKRRTRLPFPIPISPFQTPNPKP